MIETYGEREGARRMTNIVIQSQASWGAIERVENGKRLVRKDPIVITNDQAVAWLIEVTLRYVGKAVPIRTLSSLIVLYPFVLDQPIAYLASKSPNLEVRSEGSGSQSVSLRSWQ